MTTAATTFTPTTLYAIGQNVPGYLPMADEPYLCTTFDDAKRALIAEMDRSADHAAECDKSAHADAIDAAMQAVNLWSSPDSTIVTDPEREHDLGISYWIVAVDRADIDADTLAELDI